ncbi:MAG: D-alanyl-D-alanine carboxypeptidase/D-alanyl-D-alanine-endopeptidase [Chlamydiota bacterium]
MRKKIFIGMMHVALSVFCTTSYLCSEDICFLDHAIVGIYAVQSSTGKVLIEKNSELSLIPASCMKAVTTAAALHILGPNYRFETRLEYDGEIDEEKTLHGNLYIKGGGDPCLGSDRIAGVLPWEEQIKAWSQAIQELGILKIEGRVVGDATSWEKALAVPSWSWEDLGNYYGAGACALSFHENSYSLFLKPGDLVGKEATILRTDFPVTSLAFQNEVKTGPEGSGDLACIYGSEFSPTRAIRGTIPFGVKEFSIKGAIPDPAATCAALLEKELKERGVVILEVDGSFQKGRVCIHKTYSPKIQEIVRETNQKSINLYAEHLLKKMGEMMYEEGSTESGIKAVRAFYLSQDLDLTGFNMVDGSGLSRKNLVTAKQLVSMMLKVKELNIFPIFFESLPQKEDGIRAKSGSMSLIQGYVGYMEDVAFAILVNQCPEPQIRKKTIEEFFSHLTALNKKPL